MTVKIGKHFGCLLTNWGIGWYLSMSMISLSLNLNENQGLVLLEMVCHHHHC